MALLGGGFLVLGERAQAEEWLSDPKFPHEAEEWSLPAEVPFYQISPSLAHLRDLIEKERQALADLAPLKLERQFNAFGYHSDFIPVVEGVPEEPLWTLDLDGADFETDALVLVPAFDQKSDDLQGYAFPKRFRISSPASYEQPSQIIVDWTEEDFPDPGTRPVYFSFPKGGKPTGDLRLEVFSGQENGGREYFALGRVHPIRWGEPQQAFTRSVSSSFESPPYWGQRYLSSSQRALGNPLSSAKGNESDVLIEMPAARLEQPLVIRIEFDERSSLGWVNIFPGQRPDTIDVPGYGLPHSMRLFRILKSPETGVFRRILLKGFFDPRTRNLGNNFFRIAGNGLPVEALEIECNDFPVYQGKAMFSLGEIQALVSSRNLSQGRQVSIRGIPLSEEVDRGKFVDGQVGGRVIIPLTQWFQQLAEGKVHEARLADLQRTHLQLKERWERMRRQGLISLVVFLLVGILAFLWWLFRGRGKAEAHLRRQIYLDLHDEVGSNLGSISLLADQLKKVARSDRMKEGMIDLSLMTREAYASLREVVWLADQKTIRLPALIQKLSERAERVLSDVDFYSEIPEDCPDQIVSLPIKRHLMMFFKEVLHNCVRHAKASKVRFIVEIDEQHLHIKLIDDGLGFDKSRKTDGWGLGSMSQRAVEMGGEMELLSATGEGTSISLLLPLSVLSSEPSKAYKTSNDGG